MTTKRRTGQSPATRFLEELAGGPLTLGNLMEAIRAEEGLTQAEFARHLGMSRSHLCDIEKGRKTISLTRAALLAKTLGYSEKQFVRLALQGLVDEPTDQRYFPQTSTLHGIVDPIEPGVP